MKGNINRVLAGLLTLLTVIALLPGAVFAAKEDDHAEELTDLIQSAVDSAKVHYAAEDGSLLGSDRFTALASSTDSDWLALAMGRFGSDDGAREIDDDYQSYLAAMQAYIETTYREQGGRLHTVKVTEWHRAIVTIAALGGDPTHFGSYDGKPIDLVADGCYRCVVAGGPGRQDLNAWIWGLIALDAEGYTVPADAPYPRETFITEILKAQFPDGGWALGGYPASDADMTAMAIQALAPYYYDDTVYTYTNEKTGQTVSKTVRRCVNEALDRLGVLMQDDGGFLSPFGAGEAAESTAQVITALCALGIDPAEDPRFLTADGKTLLDHLLLFCLPEGGFCHMQNGGWNAMATGQSTYALVAYWRLTNNMRALYDMRESRTEAAMQAIDKAEEQISALPALSSDPTYKAALKAALAAYREVPLSERRYVYSYRLLADAIDLVGGEASLNDPALPYIVAISVTRLPDKTAYYDSERFDPTGMVVTAHYSDGSETPIEGYGYAPAGLLTTADTKIQIVYGILKTSIPITVAPAPDLQIGTVEELLEFSRQVNAGNHFKGKVVTLTADLDLDGVVWSPIAYQSKNAFEGTFDGGYHVIRNLFSMTKGIFGFAGQGAVIRNLGLASGSILTTNSDVGGIVSQCDGAEIINCWNGANISFLRYTSYGGGVVGSVRSSAGGLISGCYNTGRIEAQDGPIGGIVGYLTTGANVTVENCYNMGAITLTGDSGWWAGGVIGQAQDQNTLKHCYNAGTVTGAESGALAGALTSGVTVEGCLYDSTVSANAVGNNTHADDILGKTTEEMRETETVAALGEGYKADLFSIVNHGYPLLWWQKTEQADALLTVMEKIDAIGEVTLESRAAIDAARKAYDTMTEEWKPYLSDHLSRLEQAEAAWENLLQQAKEDAKEELTAYKNLSDYRTAEQEEIKALLTQYHAAVDAATDADGIDYAVAEGKAALDQIKTAKELADAEAVEAVIEKIRAIGENAQDSKEEIKAARAAYDRLREDLKSGVENYPRLIQAEQELAAWQALDQAKKDAKAALTAYKDLSDYRAAGQEELRAILRKAMAAIESAFDTETLSETVAAAKAQMDAVKTAKELSDEEAASSQESSTISSETSQESSADSSNAPQESSADSSEAPQESSTVSSTKSPKTGNAGVLPIYAVFMGAGLCGLLLTGTRKKG